MKNGVLWSLLLFLFDYDYTLDESGVNTDEKTNQQKSANNLARMSILAIVALCGYHMELVLNPNDPLASAIRPQNPVQKSNSGTAVSGLSTKQTAQSSPPAASAYTSNATNIIQNNAVHTIQMNNNSNKSNFTSYVNLNEKVGSSEEVFESETTVEKENLINQHKYTIGGTCNNVAVKKIIDQLLTKYIADKFATHSDSEVSELPSKIGLLAVITVSLNVPI